MAYSDIAALQSDLQFNNRCIACVATEPNPPDNPPQWVIENSWALAGTPGFGDKYASALAGGVPEPGNDPAVITDGDILSAVQTLKQRTLGM
jgi:hypothetical protein